MIWNNLSDFIFARKTPSLKDLLQILLSGIDISLLAFNNLVGTGGHGPQDLVSSSELIMSFISCGVVREVRRNVEFLVEGRF